MCSEDWSIVHPPSSFPNFDKGNCGNIHNSIQGGLRWFSKCICSAMLLDVNGVVVKTTLWFISP